jgi:hypothetical protein
MTEPTKETKELPEDIQHRVQVARAIKEKIAELKDELDNINAEVRELGEAEWTAGGQPLVSVTETKRFSPDRAKEVLPPELLALCEETTVTASKARQNLPPQVYEACQQVSGKATVRYL